MRQRLIEAPVPGWVDPALVFRALYANESRAVWLDSGMHAESGMSYLGAAARWMTATADGPVTVDGLSVPGTVLDVLRTELARAVVEPGGGFRLGWVGWLGYELRAQTMGTPPRSGGRYPDASMLFLDRAIVFDHTTHSIGLIALGEAWTGELADWREATTAAIELAGRLGPVVPSPDSRAEAPVAWAHSDDDYLRMIGDCQAAIRAGDAYQLCLTTEVSVDVRPDPFETYLRLRASSPSHHGALFLADGSALLSASPEQFLAVSPDGVVESRPIKGTRRRGASAEEDADLAAELLSSEKERAENLMIVDLMRNDLARVSEVGSVEVAGLLTVESYAHVHQLVSTVRGRLAVGRSALDAVEACFPARSMTGAPKHSAVTILDGLEGRARGVYSGAFGYFGLDGRIDLAMVIRSILLDEGGATVGSGGGITALSVPAEELEEVRLKAAALLAALGVAPTPVSPTAA